MAGHAFGGQVIAFPYREITGVEIQTRIATAVLQIQTASFSATRPGGYWSSDKATDPFKLPNCLPLPSKNVVGAWQSHLVTLRHAIAAGGFPDPRSQQHEESPAVQVDAPRLSQGLGDELRKIAELHEARLLTDDEFAQAKAKLLA